MKDVVNLEQKPKDPNNASPVRSHDRIHHVNTPATVSLTFTMESRGSRLNESSILSVVKYMSDERVAEIVRDKKIFIIIARFPLHSCAIVRQELFRRSWIEKHVDGSFSIQMTNHKIPHLQVAPAILRHAPTNFIWTNFTFNKFRYKTEYPLYSKLIHRIQDKDLSCKLGLCCLKPKLHWFQEPEAPLLESAMPRSYLLTDAAEKEAFSDDYRLTMCAGFLFELLQTDRHRIFTLKGRYSTDIVDFAIRVVKRAVNKKQHSDIDNYADDTQFVMHPELFAVYNRAFKRILQDGQSIKVFGNRAIEMVVSKIHFVIAAAIQHFPHIPFDGYNNLWIMKPVHSRFGCGYGISLYNTETSIFKHCRQFSKMSYMVQKYVERPLLIYNTKFDIRQYFMIVMDNDNNMNVWMYKNCYFKFSSQEYNVNSFWRAIHVTNHTVQRQFQNGNRNKRLPNHNMWVLSEFKNYLIKIGSPDKWTEQIYPEMVDCIKAVVEGTIEGVEYASNNFQLFGADFMITHDFHPVLIEINSSPDLQHSTISTKIVCSALVRDIIKVVVDYSRNKKCRTGDFELIKSIYFKCFYDVSNGKALEVVGIKCPIIAMDSTEPKSALSVDVSPAISNRLINSNTEVEIVKTPLKKLNSETRKAPSAQQIFHPKNTSLIKKRYSESNLSLMQSKSSRISQTFERLNSLMSKKCESVLSLKPADSIFNRNQMSQIDLRRTPSTIAKSGGCAKLKKVNNNTFVIQSKDIFLDHFRSKASQHRTGIS